MIYNERRGDLFQVPEEYNFVHCVSSDFALGAGIAVKFKEMGVKTILDRYQGTRWNGHGYCLGVKLPSGRIVYNLVTKEHYWDKPNYVSLAESLISLRLKVKNNEKLAMPHIGCGLDKLEWKRVAELISLAFQGLNVEVLVCSL